LYEIKFQPKKMTMHSAMANAKFLLSIYIPETVAEMPACKDDGKRRSDGRRVSIVHTDPDDCCGEEEEEEQGQSRRGSRDCSATGDTWPAAIHATPRES
jgi:hypothetical protein